LAWKLDAAKTVCRLALIAYVTRVLLELYTPGKAAGVEMQKGQAWSLTPHHLRAQPRTHG
jgi:hypothetical protein